MTVRTKIDHTERLLNWAEKRVRELEQEDLCGFIFKSKSPSSGMERVRVYREPPQGAPVIKGVGLFARIFMEHFPLLPVEDEGRLHDPELRENFIERLFVFQRWRELLAAKTGRGGLVAFHTRHKLLILAHSTEHYRELGKLVAGAKETADAGTLRALSVPAHGGPPSESHSQEKHQCFASPDGVLQDRI